MEASNGSSEPTRGGGFSRLLSRGSLRSAAASEAAPPASLPRPASQEAMSVREMILADIAPDRPSRPVSSAFSFTGELGSGETPPVTVLNPVSALRAARAVGSFTGASLPGSAASSFYNARAGSIKGLVLPAVIEGNPLAAAAALDGGGSGSSAFAAAAVAAPALGVPLATGAHPLAALGARGDSFKGAATGAAAGLPGGSLPWLPAAALPPPALPLAPPSAPPPGEAGTQPYLLPAALSLLPSSTYPGPYVPMETSPLASTYCTFQAKQLWEQILYQVFYPLSLPIMYCVRGHAAVMNARFLPINRESGYIALFQLFLSALAAIVVAAALQEVALGVQEGPNGAWDTRGGVNMFAAVLGETALTVTGLVFQRLAVATKYAFLSPREYHLLMAKRVSFQELQKDQLIVGWLDLADDVLSFELDLAQDRLGVAARRVLFSLTAGQRARLREALEARTAAAAAKAAAEKGKAEAKAAAKAAKKKKKKGGSSGGWEPAAPAPAPASPAATTPDLPPDTPVTVSAYWLTRALLAHANATGDSLRGGLAWFTIVVALLVAVVPTITRASFGIPPIGYTANQAMLFVCSGIAQAWFLLIILSYLRVGVLSYRRTAKALEELTRLSFRAYSDRAWKRRSGVVTSSSGAGSGSGAGAAGGAPSTANGADARVPPPGPVEGETGVAFGETGLPPSPLQRGRAASNADGVSFLSAGLLRRHTSFGAGVGGVSGADPGALSGGGNAEAAAAFLAGPAAPVAPELGAPGSARDGTGETSSARYGEVELVVAPSAGGRLQVRRRGMAAANGASFSAGHGGLSSVIGVAASTRRVGGGSDGDRRRRRMVSVDGSPGGGVGDSTSGDEDDEEDEEDDFTLVTEANLGSLEMQPRGGKRRAGPVADESAGPPGGLRARRPALSVLPEALRNGGGLDAYAAASGISRPRATSEASNAGSDDGGGRALLGSFVVSPDAAAAVAAAAAATPATVPRGGDAPSSSSSSGGGGGLFPRWAQPALTLDSSDNVIAWLVVRRLVSAFGLRYYRRLQAYTGQALVLSLGIAASQVVFFLFGAAADAETRRMRRPTDIGLVACTGLSFAGLLTLILVMLRYGADANEQFSVHVAVLTARHLEARQALSRAAAKVAAWRQAVSDAVAEAAGAAAALAGARAAALASAATAAAAGGLPAPTALPPVAEAALAPLASASAQADALVVDARMVLSSVKAEAARWDNVCGTLAAAEAALTSDARRDPVRILGIEASYALFKTLLAAAVSAVSVVAQLVRTTVKD